MACRRKRSAGGLSRREVLKYGLYGGLAAGVSANLWLGGCGQRRRGKGPNVLLIVLDTARADRFSCMGYKSQTSPNIDAIFSEGVIYQRAYSTACWTLPSHSSLFSGLYPTQAGGTSETLQLPKFNRTLAEVMKEAGYDTAAFVCNAWVSVERGFGQGFDEFNEMWRPENRPDVTQSQGPVELTATQLAASWLEQRKAAKNPFFVFINLNCIHLPYVPTEPFLSSFVGNRGYNNEEVNRIAAVKSMWPYLAGELKLSERDFRIMSDLYDAEVALADSCVGQIIGQLRASGLLDDTVVILTSDHGENLGERGRIDHHLSMYETTLHIPLMIRYPKAFQPGSRISDFVSIVDIAPTVMDLCGAGKSVERQKSAETSLARSDRQHRAFVVAGNERPLAGIGLMRERYPKFDSIAIDYRVRAIRTNLYKLIWNVGGAVELFDIKTDPGELHDISSEQLETRNKLHKMLKVWMERLPMAGDVSFLEGQDEESMKILRSLGYVK